MATFKILSLDGGGILGAFAASFLAELETQCGGEPIGQYFDLIAGTSTGGIIAGALALGEPAVRVRDFYRSDGAAIFQRRLSKKPSWLCRPFSRLFRTAADAKLESFGLDTDYLLGTKYGIDQLESSLKNFFTERTVGMCKTRLVVPSVDLTRGDTIVFKTPHLPGRNSRDKTFLMREVIRATTAAPTFFSHATIREGSAYCDGGIWANNPGMVALVEAIKISEDCKRSCDPCFEIDDIQMLSIGTGDVATALQPPDTAAGLAFWMQHISDWMMLSQARGTFHQLNYLLGDRVHRVNFPIPDKATWAMDSGDRVKQLLHLGNEKAHAELTAVKQTFLSAKATGFTAFSE